MTCVFKVKTLRIAACVFALVLTPVPTLAQSSGGAQRFFTIGTGAITGVYYNVGEAICLLVNRQRNRNGLRCSVEATPATIHNLKALRKKDFGIALAQSDAEFAAFNGREEFAPSGPDRELRSIAQLHIEQMTVVVKRDAGINSFDDLRGKRISIGSGSSGTRYSAEKVMQALEMPKGQFASVSTLKADEQGDALCKGRIDAYMYIVGHPALNITDAAANCGIKILPIGGNKIDSLIRNNTYYFPATIPGGIYPGNPAPVETYGSRALLMTTATTSDAVVYEITKAIFDNLAEFKRMHPALADLDLAQMVPKVAAAPLHPGALRYYREKGLLQ
jgi:hypothetical protein